MTPALEEAHRLLRLALRDSDTFGLLMPLPQAPISAMGFHAQQAVEKALKAVCTLRNLEVRRTHDLAALAQALVVAGVNLPVSIDEFRKLNPFAVEYRYDDEVASSMTPQEIHSLLDQIIAWVKPQFS